MSDLVVRIFSFSYRTGLPQDTSGHGGGFVFDLRCLPNPGRDPQFKEMTGLDEGVRRWLEAEPEVDAYRTHVLALVDQAVGKYVERGFDHLSIAFGCTGGQHRSVYFADLVSRHLRHRHAVEVVTEHVEQYRLGRLTRA